VPRGNAWDSRSRWSKRLCRVGEIILLHHETDWRLRRDGARAHFRANGTAGTVAHDASGIAHRDCVFRDIPRYNRAGADHAAGADGDAGQDNCARTDPDVVANTTGAVGSCPWQLMGMSLKDVR